MIDAPHVVAKRLQLLNDRGWRDTLPGEVRGVELENDPIDRMPGKVAGQPAQRAIFRTLDIHLQHIDTPDSSSIEHIVQRPRGDVEGRATLVAVRVRVPGQLNTEVGRVVRIGRVSANAERRIHIIGSCGDHSDL